MKQTLLSIFFCLTIGISGVIAASASGDLPNTNNPLPSLLMENNINIFPNPTVDYFSLTNDENIREVVVINMVGRKMRSFQATPGDKYGIGDLPNGMYLIQLIDNNSKIITTQRISKR